MNLIEKYAVEAGVEGNFFSEGRGESAKSKISEKEL